MNRHILSVFRAEANARIAARLLLADLERGRAIDAQALRTAMIAAFGRSDAEGAWTWKTGYDACEEELTVRSGVQREDKGVSST